MGKTLQELRGYQENGRNKTQKTQKGAFNCSVSLAVSFLWPNFFWLTIGLFHANIRASGGD
jgi:hypothetical protein